MICLCCGKTIKESEPSDHGWHRSCIRRFFHTKELPSIEITKEELENLANNAVQKGFTVPGVQKKLSLHLSIDGSARLTIIDYPTGYILKPQTEDFEHLPEAEDLVMRMAEIAGIATVPHALMRITVQDNAYAYITKRIDREIKNTAVRIYAMEDFCQLANRMTSDKYRGSYELCARLITRYSTRPGLDITELYYRILFLFVSGNSDMHLKNFSLIENAPGSRIYALSPAYDLLPVNLVMPEDPEELALTLNGKKRNLHKNDFLSFAASCGISELTAKRMMDKILSFREPFFQACKNSYLPSDMIEGMIRLIEDRMERLGAVAN